ncbi:MAG: hypothetical protein ACFFAS_13230 [Promethearchaeota archaeon]
MKDIYDEKLVFKLSSIEKAEEEYMKLGLNEGQKERINSYVKIIQKYIPLSEFTLKGFMWRVIKDFQVKKHLDIAEEEKLAKKADIDLDKRIAVIEMILSMLKKELTKVLISQEQEPLLDDAFKKILSLYKEQFNKNN